MASESTISEIKSRLSIVDVVAEYVPLKRAGQTFLGLCPFHKEKSASFNVHPARQCFHCFGCHKGGDVFTFLCAIEGLTFPQALEKLAARAGVPIEKTQTKTTSISPPPEIEKAAECLDWAAKYYHYLLTKKPEGKQAMAYLTKRGIGAKSIERFRLGYAPEAWTALREQMVKRGYTTAALADAGLIREDQGKSYDRFRGRLMFPITDKEGRVIGFGARTLNDHDQPKYLNSVDSLIFSKRRNLYGLHENARGIRLRGEAVIVEGYMDVVGLWEQGVDNAVAVMGTALSEDHCRQLRTLTHRVVTVFDPDRAGEEAWRNSIHLLMEHGLLARDVTLPEGKDPDDYVREQGADAFYGLCDKAPRQITKWLKQIAAKGKLSEQERITVLENMAPLLRATRKLPDRLTLWDDICLVLGVSNSILKEIGNTMPHALSTGATLRSQSRHPTTTSRPFAGTARTQSRDTIEMAFLQTALVCGPLFRSTPKEAWLPTIENASVRELLIRLHTSEGPEEINTLQTLLEQRPAGDYLTSIVSAHLVRESHQDADAEQVYKDTLKRLQVRLIENQIQGLSAQAKLAQRMGDETGALELLGKIRELRSGLGPEILALVE